MQLLNGGLDALLEAHALAQVSVSGSGLLTGA